MIRPVVALLCVGLLTACGSPRADGPNLAALYDRTAQQVGVDRNPVVVIPGILGSRLVEPSTGQVVWGAFTYGAADADYPDGARLVSLPMKHGARLADLRDAVRPDGVLESLDADVGLLRVTALEPYRGIIASLAAGRYIDRDIERARRRAQAERSAAGPIDYAGLHYTCFQFDYDWRRDVSENASRLDELIRSAAEASGKARGLAGPAKVDVVAHSMGGLVLMYYLRYGTAALPDDGSPPKLTWAGAEHVERAILVGTPSAGSVLSLKQLVEGTRYSPITPTYQPCMLGTMPAIYELLPRPRHARVVEAVSGAPIDLYDPSVWERFRWGLADPRQDRYLQWLLPDVPDAASRRRIALDHQAKCLRRAEQFHRAIDCPADPPRGLTLTLFAGDAAPTPGTLAVDPGAGRLRVAEFEPGDGTVTRASALMDERVGRDWRPGLSSPLAWSQVVFLPRDHVGLTEDPVFTDNLLYLLLDTPRRDAP